MIVNVVIMIQEIEDVMRRDATTTTMTGASGRGIEVTKIATENQEGILGVKVEAEKGRKKGM